MRGSDAWWKFKQEEKAAAAAAAPKRPYRRQQPGCPVEWVNPEDAAPVDDVPPPVDDDAPADDDDAPADDDDAPVVAEAPKRKVRRKKKSD
jgi:hypothetical protein